MYHQLGTVGGLGILYSSGRSLGRLKLYPSYNIWHIMQALNRGTPMIYRPKRCNAKTMAKIAKLQIKREYSSQIEFCRAHKADPGNLSKCLNGRMDMTPEILRGLGYRKVFVPMFERIDKEENCDRTRTCDLSSDSSHENHKEPPATKGIDSPASTIDNSQKDKIALAAVVQELPEQLGEVCDKTS